MVAPSPHGETAAEALSPDGETAAGLPLPSGERAGVRGYFGTTCRSMKLRTRASIGYGSSPLTPNHLS